ncbi:transposable element Tc1 transposase [Trichonephila clavipes]|nr:transposable element Tc1 transposase [Trichonephila clavipes]
MTGLQLVKHFLSPFEHVWDMMGRRLHLPENIDDLARQLTLILQEIPQETIRLFYHSMPRHMASCIQARVGVHLGEGEQRPSPVSFSSPLKYSLLHPRWIKDPRAWGSDSP